MEYVDLLITNANELLTLNGSQKPRVKKEMNNVGIIKGGSIAVKDGIIVDVGTDLAYDAEKTIDARGKIVLPGFIDPHTHLVFGGTRESELNWKLNGLSYMDIKKRGGGISYTVEHTRKATSDELFNQGKKRLDTMLLYGTTTCEAKSGYGLDTDTEMKIIDVQHRLHDSHPVDIVSTFLGAHAIPEGRSEDEYIDTVIHDMLPLVKDKVLFCDVFCEEGFFSYDQSEHILGEGKKHGLVPKVHADELHDMNGGVLAAEMEAISAEHLLHVNATSMKMMAKQNVIGVLLPGTPFSLMMKMYAPAREMIKNGVPIALATDLNPNCYVENMQFIIQLACFNMAMTPAESITAATFNAACAINKQKDIGSLEVGKQADILIMNCQNHIMIPYHFGMNHVEKVIKRGEIQ